MARKALRIAGDPSSVLDLPCGAGRFWPLLAEKEGRAILAADYSPDMLDVARASHPESLVSRIKIFQCSAFDIKLDDESVENIFSMRLLHHIGKSSERLAMLKEYFRVARDSVCISLWVDGNYKARKRRKLEIRRGKKPSHSRVMIPRSTIEEEFEEAGFKITAHLDLLKYYSMWRLYILSKR
jgi:ubiquinone/menaquinone biosynthesis C-methylase UbiE